MEPGAKPNPNWHYHLTFKELLHKKMLVIFLIVAGLSCFGVCLDVVGSVDYNTLQANVPYMYIVDFAEKKLNSSSSLASSVLSMIGWYNPNIIPKVTVISLLSRC